MFMATCGKRAPVDRPVSYNVCATPSPRRVACCISPHTSLSLRREQKIYSTGLEIDDDDSDIDDDAEEEKLYS